jgi:hypothetical protein
VVEIYVRACSGEGRAPSVSEGAPMPLT